MSTDPRTLLGPTGGQVSGARSIQINSFVNHTSEPRLTDALTHALRQHPPRSADSFLNGTPRLCRPHLHGVGG